MIKSDGPFVDEWAALGTSVRVVLSGPADRPAARRAVEGLLARVDLACSRFRDDSGLAALNRSAGEWAPAEPLLLDALDAAIWAAAATGGAVDPTVGRALRVAGYDRDFAAVATDGGPIVLRLEPAPGWTTVEVDRRRGRARVPRGVEIDLGATAKALAADQAAAIACQASGAQGVLVSLGGDIAMAGQAPECGWPVLVAEDCAAPPDGEGQVVLIADGGIATSSMHVRQWTRGGVEQHHIIDPATGAPVLGPWRTATVVAASCLEANAAATAAIVKADAAPAWLDELALPARLVARDGAVVTAGGWPGHEAPAW
jgi:thiamine biosynthesis lipoprotein